MLLENITDYLRNTYGELRLIADLVANSGLDNVPMETIEIVAKNNVERNWVTEVYVVESGFDGEHPPLAAFEFDDDKLEQSLEEG